MATALNDLALARLATAEDATWAVLGEAADHPRLLEFTVQVCGLILGSQPTEERAIFLTEKLTEALASAAEQIGRAHV